MNILSLLLGAGFLKNTVGRRFADVADGAGAANIFPASRPMRRILPRRQSGGWVVIQGQLYRLLRRR